MTRQRRQSPRPRPRTWSSAEQAASPDRGSCYSPRPVSAGVRPLNDQWRTYGPDTGRQMLEEALKEFREALIRQGVYDRDHQNLDRAYNGAKDFVDFLLDGPAVLRTHRPRNNWSQPDNPANRIGTMAITQTPDPSDLPVADRGRRLLAFVVDGPVVWAMSFVVGLIWAAIDPPGFEATIAHHERGFTILLFGIYVIPCWAIAGTSLGKWLLGLKLVGPRQQPPGVLRAFVRFLVMAALNPLFGLPWWPVLVRRDRREIHDLLAGTRLIQTVPSGPAFLR